jgi:CDP-paratose 2-epimerase
MKDINRILITGGAGFVGSSLALQLMEHRRGCEIAVFDNLTRRGSELNLARLTDAGISFIHGDIRLPGDLRNAGSFDLLIHCAAEPSVQAGLSEGSPGSVLDINLTGTINCLEAARQNDAAFQFISTSRVYPIHALNEIAWTESKTRFEWCDTRPGLTDNGITEDFTLTGGRSYYGAGKLAAEIIAQEYASHGLPVIINRCGVLTGPWQMGKVDQGVVALWVLRHHFDQPLQYIGFEGQGKQVRDILHVRDLGGLISRQLQKVDEWDGSLYNVGGSRANSVSLRELTSFCRDIVGRRIRITPVVKTSPVDLRIFTMDNSKVSSEFDWEPEITPLQIVEEIHDWVVSHESAIESAIIPRARHASGKSVVSSEGCRC